MKWSNLLNKNPQKKKNSEKHFMMFFITYILFIFTWILIDSEINFLIKFFLPLPLLFFILTSILKFLDFKNHLEKTYLIFFVKIYNKIINWKYNIFDQKRFPVKKRKVEWDKVILYIFFIMIPFFFLALIITGSWQNQTGYRQDSGTLFGEIGNNHYLENGEINIKANIDLDIIQEVFYLIGKEIDKPLLDICFKNEGVPTLNYMNNTLETQVEVNNITFNIPFGEEMCIPVEMSQDKVYYVWNSSYLSNLSEMKNFEDVKFEEINSNPTKEEIRINKHNLGFISIAFLLGYWAILVLLIRVILYLYLGLELKKN